MLKPKKFKRNCFSSFWVIFVTVLKKVILKKMRLKFQLEFPPREKILFKLKLNHLFRAHIVTLLQKCPIPRMQFFVACKAIFLRGYSLPRLSDNQIRAASVFSACVCAIWPKFTPIDFRKNNNQCGSNWSTRHNFWTNFPNYLVKTHYYFG